MNATILRAVCLALNMVLLPAPRASYDRAAIYCEMPRYNSVLSDIYENNLTAAGDSVKNLITEKPGDPKPYFFLALVRWWYFIGDINSETFKASFLDAAGKAVEIGRSRLEQHDDDAEAQFYLGASYGYLARYYLLTNSLLNAYSYGRKSKDIFNNMLEKDGNLYDADLAIGTYNCYADRLPGLLKLFATVIGLGGDARLGLAQLRLAADSGSYSRVEASIMLGYVKLELENDYGGAAEIFSKLSADYGSNPLFRMLLANSYRKSGRYDKAILVCAECLNDNSVRYSSMNQLAGMHAELAYCYMLGRYFESAATQYKICDSLATGSFLRESPWIYFNLGFCEEKLGNFVEAEVYYRKVLDCEDYFGYRSRAGESIERVRAKSGIHP